MKTLRFTALVLLSIFTLYNVAAVIGAVVPEAGRQQTEGKGDIEVLLYTGPIHYDFLIPAIPEARAAFGFAKQQSLPADDPRLRWFVVGWGARAFYTSMGGYSDVTAQALWKAITGDTAVIRIDTVGALRPDLDVLSLKMTEVEFARFLSAINASFKQSDDQTRLPIDAQLTGTDAFYEAEGTFNIFITCNTWISRILRDTGFQFGYWTPTPYAVTLSHWLWQNIA